MSENTQPTLFKSRVVPALVAMAMIIAGTATGAIASAALRDNSHDHSSHDHSNDPIGEPGEDTYEAARSRATSRILASASTPEAEVDFVHIDGTECYEVQVKGSGRAGGCDPQTVANGLAAPFVAEFRLDGDTSLRVVAGFAPPEASTASYTLSDDTTRSTGVAEGHWIDVRVLASAPVHDDVAVVAASAKDQSGASLWSTELSN